MHNNPLTKYEQIFAQYKLTYVKKGEVILRPEDHVQYMHYIRSGFLESYFISHDGSQVSHTCYTIGDIFPLTLINGDGNNDYYYEALTPVEVYKIPKEVFDTFIMDNRQLLYELTLYVTSCTLALFKRVEQFAIGKAYHKVAARLAFLAENFGHHEGNNIIIPIPLTHEDIANSLGLTRETTSIQIKQLERSGLIKYKGNFIVIRSNKFGKKFHASINI